MKNLIILTMLLAATTACVGQTVEINDRAGNFTLVDTSNHPVNLGDFIGKTCIIDIWYTGCSGCIGFYQNKLAPLLDTLGHREDIVFISISLDKDMEIWKKSIREAQYTSHSAMNLYTGGQWTKHPIITQQGIKAVPHLYIVDKRGRISEIIGYANRLTAAELAARINAVL